LDLIIHVDGGSRGNPGPAGAGVIIRDQDGNRIHEAGYFLGRQTNNAAEYEALIRALRRVQLVQAQRVTVHSDSELLVRQLTGEYQVKSPRLARLFHEAQVLLLKLPRWTVRHIPREANVRADELANLAMDRRQDVVVFDVESGADTAAGCPTPATETAIETAAREQPAAAPPALPRGRPAVRVTVAEPPGPAGCPAGEFAETAFTVEARLPAGLCIHAAHAILPTLLAILNTEPREFAAIPTLTIRCPHAGCGAVFQLSPVRGSNGAGRAEQP
jgi:ribonuclease HI